MENIFAFGLNKEGNTQIGRAKGFNFDAGKAYFLVWRNVMDIASSFFWNIIAEYVGGVVVAAIGKDLL